MSTIEIALAPDLKVEPRDFVAAWNETPDCRNAAEAEVGDAKTATYDPTLASFAVAVLTGVVSGVTVNVLSEYIKRALAKRGVSRPVEVIEVNQPGGARLLVVRVPGGSS